MSALRAIVSVKATKRGFRVRAAWPVMSPKVSGTKSAKGDKAAAKNYPADYRGRYVLGRALVARGEVERLTTALENAKDHGGKRRFRVWEDSKTRSRWISEFDIKCRADARAMRHVYEQEILDWDIRRERR